jgi:hypothetical protein
VPNNFINYYIRAIAKYMGQVYKFLNEEMQIFSDLCIPDIILKTTTAKYVALGNVCALHLPKTGPNVPDSEN